jgi:SAF domain
MPRGDRNVPPGGAGAGTLPARNGQADGFRLTGAAGRRRHVGRVAVGVVLVVACAALTVALVGRAGHRLAVLAVTRPVAAGQPISAEDLRVVTLSGAGGVALTPAGELAVVVGRPAAVPLVAGSLLTAGQVGDPSVPAVGRALVGVAVKPGQYPPGLAAGDHVAVVNTAPASAATSAAPSPAGTAAPVDDDTLAVGIVAEVQAAGLDGAGVVVTVDVPDTAAQAVAVASGNGQAGLVQRPAND